MILIDVHLGSQYFLLFLLLRTKTNQKVFWLVSMPASPCEKHGFWKFSPRTCSDCAWALLMVIANSSDTGNCQYHFVIVWLPKLLKWGKFCLCLPAHLGNTIYRRFSIMCSHGNKYYYKYFNNFFHTYHYYNWN